MTEARGQKNQIRILLTITGQISFLVHKRVRSQSQVPVPVAQQQYRRHVHQQHHDPPTHLALLLLAGRILCGVHNLSPRYHALMQTNVFIKSTVSRTENQWGTHDKSYGRMRLPIDNGNSASETKSDDGAPREPATETKRRRTTATMPRAYTTENKWRRRQRRSDEGSPRLPTTDR